MLSKTKVCVTSYDGKTKWMYFLIEDNNKLKKDNTTSDKISADIKMEFDNKSVCNKKCFENQKKILEKIFCF